MHRKLPALLGALALGLLIGKSVLAQEKTETHQGAVVNVKGNELRMMHPDGTEHIHILAPDGKVFCDNKPCKLSDLKPGMHIWVTTPVNNLKTALRIEAKPAEGGNQPGQPQEQQPRAATRPFLGIWAESAQGGVQVREAQPNGPAAQAGLKEGDLIQKINNQPLQSFEDLVNRLAPCKPGDKVDLHFRRGNEEKDATVTLGERPQRPAAANRRESPAGFLGVATQDLTQDQRNRLAIPPEQGARVVQVMANTPAAKAGLQKGDVIWKLNNQAVNGPMGLAQAVQRAGAGQEVTLQILRGDQTKDFKARLEESPVEFFPSEGR